MGFGHSHREAGPGHNDGLPLEAFVHRWKTQRTETYTDSEGNTQTRTVTEHHAETVCVVNLPFAFPLISVGGGWGGQRVRFESEEFNDRFKVKTNSPKFTYDVIHPRTMEFMMAAQPPDFRIEDQLMRFSVGSHDTLMIGFCADFAHEFFGRVPSFVWKNLGLDRPEFRRSGMIGWVHVSIDLPTDHDHDPARFWAEALGWPLGEPWSEWPEFSSFQPEMATPTCTGSWSAVIRGCTWISRSTTRRPPSNASWNSVRRPSGRPAAGAR